MPSGVIFLPSSEVFRDAFDTVIQAFKIQALSTRFCPLHHTDITLQALEESRDCAFSPHLCMRREHFPSEGSLTRRRLQVGEMISALAMRCFARGRDISSGTSKILAEDAPHGVCNYAIQRSSMDIQCLISNTPRSRLLQFRTSRTSDLHYTTEPYQLSPRQH